MPIKAAQIRQPVKGEVEYFRSHLDVAAMATDDNRVVFNPFVELSDDDRRALLMNESARIAMLTEGYAPRAALTRKQRHTVRSWSDSPYSQDAMLARQTVLARILAGDESLAPYAPRQIAEAMRFANRKRRGTLGDLAGVED